MQNLLLKDIDSDTFEIVKNLKNLKIIEIKLKNLITDTNDLFNFILE